MKSHVIPSGNLTEAETDLFPNTPSSSTQAKITWNLLPFSRLVTSFYLARRLVLFTTRPMLQPTQFKIISLNYFLK